MPPPHLLAAVQFSMAKKTPTLAFGAAAPLSLFSLFAPESRTAFHVMDRPDGWHPETEDARPFYALFLRFGLKAQQSTDGEQYMCIWC